MTTIDIQYDEDLGNAPTAECLASININEDFYKATTGALPWLPSAANPGRATLPILRLERFMKRARCDPSSVQGYMPSRRRTWTCGQTASGATPPFRRSTEFSRRALEGMRDFTSVIGEVQRAAWPLRTVLTGPTGTFFSPLGLGLSRVLIQWPSFSRCAAALPEPVASRRRSGSSRRAATRWRTKHAPHRAPHSALHRHGIGVRTEMFKWIRGKPQALMTALATRHSARPRREAEAVDHRCTT